jgi:hypothetical protein
MPRTVLGVIAGFVVWWLVVTVIDRTMRSFWPDYAAVFQAMTFTLPMMFARLAESTVAITIAALVAARVAPASRNIGWAFGIVMLLFFIPIHYGLWSRFPVWYHAYFLGSLVAIPLIVTSVRRETAPAAG